MDKSSRKKGHRGATRKKRLQIDLSSHTQSSVTSTEELVPSNSQESTAETHEKAPMASSSTGAEDASNEASASRPKSASPEPNCAICLGKLENKSFTDSCFHMFCFVCLEEWSKVKAECPLCKQKFQSIIHNVRSLDDYDQYQVQQGLQQGPQSHLDAGFNLDISHGQRFRYRTTVTDHRYAFAHMWERERESRMLQIHTRLNDYPNLRRQRQPSNAEFRRSIYERKFKIKQDQMNTRRRIRETSPSFFRENPAQSHRLVPWLNRELVALLEGHGSQVAFVLELIMGLIKRYQIDSDEFYEHVYPFTRRRTRQFMAEFLNFAKSPYHMANYDSHVTYEPQAAGANLDSGSDSDINMNVDDDGSDSDVIVVSPSSTSAHTGSRNCPGAPQRSNASLDPWERSVLASNDAMYLGFRPIVRSRGHEDLTDTTIVEQNPYCNIETGPSVSGWDSPTIRPTTSFIACGDRVVSGTLEFGSSDRNSYEVITNYLRTLPDFASPGPSTSAPPVVSNSHTDPISCSESDEESNASDIMIVDYEKPWNERSPIKLSSGEESDFDLMITGMSYATDPVKKERKKKKKKKEHVEKTEPLEKRKRGEEDLSSSGDRHHKSKRRRSRNRSRSRSSLHAYQSEVYMNPYRHKSRSRSGSPIRLRLHNYSDYLHKKYHYHHPASTISRRASYRSRPHRSFSGSSTDTGSDDESHVSIRSKKGKTSGRSSIEIVEYRKTHSKYKSGKKHSKSRSCDRDRQSDSLGASKSKKSKKDKNDPKRKKSKKKSKHKKCKHGKKEDTVEKSKTFSSDPEKMDDGNNGVISDEEIDPLGNDSDTDNYANDKSKRSSVVGTSDSELDSYTENESLCVNENRKKHLKDETVSAQSQAETVKAAHSFPYSNTETSLTVDGFSPSTLELVELTPFESAAFDKELENITKILPIAPSLESNDVNTYGVPPKSFKKHPHGHKKSSKRKLVEETMAYATSTSSGNLILNKCAIVENNIQSSDITSCTDILSTSCYPGYQQNIKDDYQISMQTNMSKDFQSIESENNKYLSYSTMKSNIPTTVNESPSSSGYLNVDIVDVETLSENSDVDITHVEEKPINVEGLSDSDSDIYINSIHNERKNDNIEELIDVVGSSCEDSDAENVNLDKGCSKRSFSNASDSNLDDENVNITVDSDSNDGYGLVVESDSEIEEIDVLTHVENDNKEEKETDNKPLANTDMNITTQPDNSNVIISSFSNNYISEKVSSNEPIGNESSITECEQIQEITDVDHLMVVSESLNTSNQKLRENTFENSNTIDKMIESNVNSIRDSEQFSNCDNSVVVSNADYLTEMLVSSGNKQLVNLDTPTENLGCPYREQKSSNSSEEFKSSNNVVQRPSYSYQGGPGSSDNSEINESRAIERDNEGESEEGKKETRETPQISLNWTADQIFEASSSSITPSSFVSLSTRRDEQPRFSPPYMATLYNNRPAELVLSPDLPFDSLPQRSPGQLSSASSLSENEPDNFVAED